MNFALTEQHKMLRRTVQDFSTKEIAPIAQKIDKSGEFPWDCVRKMASRGFFGLLTPPAFGGTGPDRLGFLIALEEISVASAGLALSLAVNSLISYIILALGNDEQKAKYLPALAKGERLGALGAAESSGGANFCFTMQSKAVLEGESYVLNGTKCFTSNGGEADIYLILARTDPEKGPMGISGLIVEKGVPGFTFGKKEEKLGLRCDVTCELVFEDCRVPKANLLTENILMPMETPMTMTIVPALGAIAAGLARGALEAACEYVKQRAVTSGQTLANLDSVQCAIADMTTKVEASRLLVYQCGAMSESEPDLSLPLMASIFPCEVASEVTSQALQLFGTYGYTVDFPLERYFRDAMGLTLTHQPIELRKLCMGRMRLGLSPMVPPGS